MSDSDFQKSARRAGSRLLRFPDFQAATRSDFAGARIAIFIHGFTADAGYMKDMMHQFAGAGFCVLAFEYPSDRGNQHSARVLKELLELNDVQGLISSQRVSLVCHSMGGLVARALVALENGGKYVKDVITLGTPNNGTLHNRWVLRLMLSWGEFVSGLNPQAFARNTLAGRELTENDPAPTFLSRLLAASPASGVQYFSISGGYSALEFGSSKIKNRLGNAYLQALFSQPNDGLVEESNSDLSQPQYHACAKNCRHFRSYAEYAYTNHSNLVKNQTVLSLALSCVDPPGPTAQEYVETALARAESSG